MQQQCRLSYDFSFDFIQNRTKKNQISVQVNSVLSEFEVYDQNVRALYNNRHTQKKKKLNEGQILILLST